MICQTCDGNGEMPCSCNVNQKHVHCEHCHNGVIECPRCNGTGILD